MMEVVLIICWMGGSICWLGSKLGTIWLVFLAGRLREESSSWFLRLRDVVCIWFGGGFVAVGG